MIRLKIFAASFFSYLRFSRLMMFLFTSLIANRRWSFRCREVFYMVVVSHIQFFSVVRYLIVSISKDALNFFDALNLFFEASKFDGDQK